MREVQVYEAFDGSEFRDKAECEAYEAKNRPSWWPLVGLTAAEVKAAVEDPKGALAGEIITIGYSLGMRRRKRTFAPPVPPTGSIVHAEATLRKAAANEPA